MLVADPHPTPVLPPTFMRPRHADDEPISRTDLLDVFVAAERPDPSTHLVGTELEKFGVRVPADGGPLLPIDYGDIANVLAALCERHGWEIGPDHGIDGEVVELRRDGASITLEPGGQLELSGKPLQTIHQTCGEFTQHYRELHDVSLPLSLSWFAAGFHPFATRDELNWMPKGRYRVMREFLPTRGARGLDMMLRTCTVQANFDFASEQQCGSRMRVANAIAPMVAAMFANSPHVEGRDTGLRTARSTVWTDVDNDRCGTPDFVFDGQPFSYERYVDWAIDVPMFFVKRDDRYHPHHVPFSQFMREGFTDAQGRHHTATWADWITHMSTVFPEVRLKPFIEFRSADAVSSKYVCALPALLKGILYSEDACAELWQRLGGLDAGARAQLWFEARHAGLSSALLQPHAQRMLQLAREGLERADVRDDRGRTEARFLDRLEPLVRGGQSPADLVLEEVGGHAGRTPEGQRALVRAHYFAGVEP